MKHIITFRRGTFASLLLATVVAIAACDPIIGPNTPGPEITDLAVEPTSVTEGDTVVVTLRATATAVIQTVRFTFGGVMQGTQSFTLEDPSDDIEESFWISPSLGSGPDSVLTLMVTVIDANEKEDSASVTVNVADATSPAVSASASPASVGPNDPIRIDVEASDNRGLDIVGVRLSNDEGWFEVHEDTLDAGVRSYVGGFDVTAPADIPVGEILVEAYARDINGISSDAAPQTISLTDDTGPTILSLNAPAQIPLGQPLPVEVRIVDPTGIKSVTFAGLAVRGRVSHGEDTVVVRFPPRTVTYPRTQADTLFHELTLQHELVTEDDTTAEWIELVTVAEDALGNTTTRRDSVYIGGPDVDFVFPAEDTMYVTLAQPVEVKIRVRDTQDIVSAFIEFWGAGKNDTIALPGLVSDTAATYAFTAPNAVTQFRMHVRATNARNIPGVSDSVVVIVDRESALPSDTVRPTVSVDVGHTGAVAGDYWRLERYDTVTISVLAHDANAGLERIGLWAVATRGLGLNQIRDTLFVPPMVLDPSTRNQRELLFSVPLDSLYSHLDSNFRSNLPDIDTRFDSISPDTLQLQSFAFAVDTAGLVGCTSGPAESRRCTDIDADSATAYFTPADTGAIDLDILLVRGRTIGLQNPFATIADLAIDTLDDRLYLSNITDNLVEVLQLEADARQTEFTSAVQVGSAPWGLFIGERVVSAEDFTFRGSVAPNVGDTVPTLIVANSGGTNMSLVHLDNDAARIEEVDQVRLMTPNTVIYQFLESVDLANKNHYTGEFMDFSDRPQFVAQDSDLRLVYSTVPTEAANTSTIRYGMTDPDPGSTTDEIEVRMLITDDMVSSADAAQIAVTNVDSVRIYAFAAGDSVQVFTHKPGYPDQPLYNSQLYNDMWAAIADVQRQIDTVMANRGIIEQAPFYYPYAKVGLWDLETLGLSDTTFVSASGDRSKIVIGEGAKAPTGRIIVWHGGDCTIAGVDSNGNNQWQCASLSDEVQIADLISNASERVLGVGLNQNGTLGVARGQDATYFFTPDDLRLQGLFQQPQSGGAGATFHPDHNSLFSGGHNDPTGAGAAFTGTSNRSIEVVNTFHFNQVNNLFIRDQVVGPLKAGPALASDNGGLSPAQCIAAAGADEAAVKQCVVARVYGITDSGGVVIVPVRRGDLEPYSLQ